MSFFLPPPLSVSQCHGSTCTLAGLIFIACGRGWVFRGFHEVNPPVSASWSLHFEELIVFISCLGIGPGESGLSLTPRPAFVQGLLMWSSQENLLLDMVGGDCLGGFTGCEVVLRKHQDLSSPASLPWLRARIKPLKRFCSFCACSHTEFV